MVSKIKQERREKKEERRGKKEEGNFKFCNQRVGGVVIVDPLTEFCWV
jgi:hypothetical protein